MWISRNTRCIYSRGGVEESSQMLSKESSPCVPLRLKNTNSRYLEKDSQTYQSGMMSEHSEQTIRNVTGCSTICVNSKTILSFPEDFLAKISRALEKVKAFAEREAGYGLNLLESFAKFDRDSFSWRIPHFLSLGELNKFSGTFPKWGMMVHGECYRLNPWDADISVIDSGGSSKEGMKIMYPTPTCNDFKGPGKNGTNRDRLDYAVIRGRTKTKLYPTPCCNGLDGEKHARNMLDKINILNGNSPKSVNPEWDEWLMLFPIGWTDVDRDGGTFIVLYPNKDPAENEVDPIPRITHNTRYKKGRLSTIGNAQVPIVALMAMNYGFNLIREFGL